MDFAQGMRWEQVAKMTLAWPLLGRFLSLTFAMGEESTRVGSGASFS